MLDEFSCTKYLVDVDRALDRMAHFYLTLPSNSSMHYYPNNTVTRYTTRLENSIALSGDWEVGLVEIQYQHTWFNLERGEGRVTYAQTVEVRGKPTQLQNTMRLTNGHYDSVPEVVDCINTHIKDTANKFELSSCAEFTYNNITKRMHGDICKGASVHFSTALCSMLGMGNAQIPISNTSDASIQWKSNNACDINRGFTSMYIYCSVLEHIPVGDTKAPLLRIVHISGKSGDIVHTIYEKPLYIPLQQKHFDSIEIDIRSDTGKPIPFQYGKVIVTLHFRLRKVPYLLQ